jgi:Arc/MetJ family transcription regulator
MLNSSNVNRFRKATEPMTRLRDAPKLSSIDALSDANVDLMRTTLVLDDELLDEAQRLTGITEKTALVREAMRALVERESSRRLAALGGRDPEAKAPPRRRSA